MKPQKVKQLLSRFGIVGRVFLQPEDPGSYARRKRFGGNKKRSFEDGWVEFMDKKAAKLVVETLNATTIGGSKSYLL
jgi:ESF2/ABP1 family protein